MGEMYAIKIRRGYKSYGDNKVLQGLNMTVPKGVIYTLLGSSGSGKTSLLNCIMGLIKLDSGNISILNGESLGFMPQQVGVQYEFTVLQILEYFGRIYGMPHSLIKERTEKLTQLLKLENHLNKTVGSLSGGEERRVSLAISMINKPKVLILDEPTSQSDPLLRQSIWKELRYLSENELCTILITSHSYEESRKSDMMAVLRNGRLVFEMSPNSLLNMYQTQDLDTIVLQLCKQQDETIRNSENDNYYLHKSEQSVIGIQYSELSPEIETEIRKDANYNKKKEPLKIGKFLERRGRAILSIARGNFINFHYYYFIIIGFIMISGVNMFSLSIIGSPIPGKISVTNLEAGLTLNSTGDNFGLKLIEHLERSNLLTVFQFPSEEESLESVKLGLSDGYLVIPNNFSAYLTERFIFGKFATEETINKSTVKIGLDNSNSIKAKPLAERLVEIYIEFVKDLAKEFDSNNTELKDDNGPFKFQSIFSERKLSDFVLPAIASLLVVSFPLVMGVTFVRDKKRGVIQRTIVAGANIFDVLISYIISTTPIMMAQICACYGVAVFLANFPMYGSFIGVFILSYLMALIGLFYGIFLGIVCHREIEVITYVLLVFIPILNCSGAVFDLQTVDYWTRKVCELLPLTLPTAAIRNISFKGWSITHPQILLGFAVPLGYLLILLILIIVFRKRAVII